MRITTTSTAVRLALAAAIMSAAPVGAFVSPALHMMAAGRGPEAPVGSKSLSPWSFSSSIGQRDVPVQRTQHAKARGGAVGPLGAVSLPATDRILQTPWDGTSNEAVLASSLVSAALHCSMIVAFIGTAESLAVRCSLAGATPAFSRASRWTLWVGAVFASGVIAAGPKKWLEQSQLISALKIEDVIVGKEWYENLRKPWFNPPKWVFPVMWIPLKVLQVFACYEMWVQLKVRSCLAAPVVVYAAYKSLGDAWNKIFFESRRLKMANVVMSLYMATLLVGIKLFFDVSNKAGLFFAPTAAWVAVATCLQWNTWLLNRDDPHA